jgi:hypothetical protein
MKRIALVIYIILSHCIQVYAHHSWEEHGKEIMEIFGFKYNRCNLELYNSNNDSWLRFISSEMIDKDDFHYSIEKDYPGFKISGPKRHRLLWHWAFNAEAWNEDLEKIFREYCEQADLNIESNIRILKSKLQSEQNKRNRLILKRTQEVFGLGNGGIEHKYTSFFASMAYNLHILGDYTSDNTSLDGLCGFDKLIGQFIVNLRDLDHNNSKIIIKEITKINNQNIDIQKKADLLMEYFKKTIPGFIQTACNGSLKRIIEARKNIIFVELP